MNPDYNISNEEALLLKLCRLAFTDEMSERIRELVFAVTDWNYFGSLANKHGVEALVYHNLKKYDLLADIPVDVTSGLRNALMLNLSRNTSHIKVMEDILKLLNSENIKTVLLKGLALELTDYGNAGLRQMTDIDVLIRKDQSIKARKILLSNGFVSLPVKSIIYKSIISSIGKHLPSLIREGTSFEIHTELFGAGASKLTTYLYESSYETEINGEKTFIPKPQIFFLYLIKHLFLHELNNESQLRLYTDLVVLMDNHREEIVNQELLSLAAQAGMEEILAQRLEPIGRFWGIRFPEWLNEFIGRWIRPGSSDSFIFFLRSPKENPVTDKSKFYRQIIKDIPGFHRKLLFLTGDIFPTISFMKKRYRCKNKWKALLFYPHRFGKILYLFGKK
jgi:hypothetical protein